jgi:hypothetical protein
MRDYILPLSCSTPLWRNAELCFHSFALSLWRTSTNRVSAQTDNPGSNPLQPCVIGTVSSKKTARSPSLVRYTSQAVVNIHMKTNVRPSTKRGLFATMPVHSCFVLYRIEKCDRCTTVRIVCVSSQHESSRGCSCVVKRFNIDVPYLSVSQIPPMETIQSNFGFQRHHI